MMTVAIVAEAGFSANIGTAEAAHSSYVTPIEAMTNAPAGCQIGTTNNDKLNVGVNKDLQVNLDYIFGISTWEFVSKAGFSSGDSDDANSGPGLTLTGSPIKGTFSISDAVFKMYTNFAFVLKGGRRQQHPAELHRLQHHVGDGDL